LHELTQADSQAHVLVKKLKKSLAETLLIDGYAIQISVSISMAIYPDNGNDIQALLAKATQALYVDKGYLNPVEGIIDTE
jgi:predicted signal transduction protein with EAL and GGDEF domain